MSFENDTKSLAVLDNKWLKCFGNKKIDGKAFKQGGMQMNRPAAPVFHHKIHIHNCTFT